MLKKYLSSYYSNEQKRSKKIIAKTKLDFQALTRAKFINQDTTQKTIDYSSPKINNLGIEQPSFVKAKQTNLSLYAQQLLSRNNNQSIDNTPKKGLDLLVTQKDEAHKYRSVSQTQRDQLLKRQCSEEKCKSTERIKVIDVFHQSPRHTKQSSSYQTYIASKEALKVKLKQQCQISRPKQSRISIHTNSNQQLGCIKQPISSRLNDSRDILSQMRRNSINNQQVITKKKYFFNSPQNNESVAFEPEKQPNNENILELLLLSTQELNQKFKNKLIRNESEEKMPAKIRVRAGSKFPKDFFQ